MCIDPFSFIRGWEFISHGASTGLYPSYKESRMGAETLLPVSSSWWPLPNSLYYILYLYIFWHWSNIFSSNIHICFFLPLDQIFGYTCLFWISWPFVILLMNLILKCTCSATDSPGDVWCRWLSLFEPDASQFSFLFVCVSLPAWFWMYFYCNHFLFAYFPSC